MGATLDVPFYSYHLHVPMHQPWHFTVSQALRNALSLW